tara:strand:- start:906 stop:2054 length:1149 start_codon:yes stop_codon:yes gene_type:complete
MSEETKQTIKQEGDFKIKSAKVMGEKKSNAPIKVDLTKKPKQDAVPVTETRDLVEEKQTGDLAKVDKQVPEPIQLGETKEDEDTVTLEEITNDTEKIASTPVYNQPKIDLPENVEKLVEFMQETGGTIEDYARLNADYSNVDENTLLKEYYKNTKPHLTDEDLTFVMEENFQFDEEIDEERDIRKKKLAKKEEIAKAKDFLNGMKDKYYKEIKLRPSSNPEQQKASEFFDRYNKDQQLATKRHDKFLHDTKELLNDEFKGFDFEVGEKKFRYGIKNPNQVAENQSNINNFVKKFLDAEGNVNDPKGYHKAMYAAQNVDKIISHFYEQGKTDGVKTVMESSKNPTIDGPRQTAGDIFVEGFKVKALNGMDSSKLKITKRKFNN